MVGECIMCKTDLRFEEWRLNQMFLNQGSKVDKTRLGIWNRTPDDHERGYIYTSHLDKRLEHPPLSQVVAANIGCCFGQRPDKYSSPRTLTSLTPPPVSRAAMDDSRYVCQSVVAGVLKKSQRYSISSVVNFLRIDGKDVRAFRSYTCYLTSLVNEIPHAVWLARRPLDCPSGRI
jgi:hypothetical protein